MKNEKIIRRGSEMVECVVAFSIFQKMQTVNGKIRILLKFIDRKKSFAYIDKMNKSVKQINLLKQMTR